MAKKVTAKKVTTKRTTKKKDKPVDDKVLVAHGTVNTIEKDLSTFEQKNMGAPRAPMDEKTFPSLVSLIDKGIQGEIDYENKIWNERLFLQPEIKGTALDRFPLSPSQAGKCALALARNLSHYLGVADYPRSPESLLPRIKRIFNRGHLLEAALIEDFEKYTPLKIFDKQRRIRMPFALGGGKRFIEGSLDGIAISTMEDGTRILLDYKSKGAFYSADFKDSINATFQGYRQTGLVSEFDNNSFLITDALAFFNVIDLNDFFVDYLLQLNAYAFAVDAETGEKIECDFCALYYENKNSCENYELRWTPHPGLLQFTQEKFEFIYNSTREVAASKPTEFDAALMAKVPREFSLGSARCKLCDQKDLCYGKYDPSTKVSSISIGQLPPELDALFVNAIVGESMADRTKQEVLSAMDKQNATHITLSNGICFERRWYKGNTNAYQLKQVSKPK